MPAPQVRPARYGLLASAVGAAALVLHHELRPMHARATAKPFFESSDAGDSTTEALLSVSDPI
jgi:hypothetical protein